MREVGWRGGKENSKARSKGIGGWEVWLRFRSRVIRVEDVGIVVCRWEGKRLVEVERVG